MRQVLPLLLLFSTAAHAEDALECRLARGEELVTLRAPLVANQSIVKTGEANELGLALDASLGQSSYIVTVQDEKRQRRVAFTGSPAAASIDGSLLELGESQVRCQSKLDAAPSFKVESEEKPNFLVCMLDEAKFVNGDAVEQKRRLVSVISPLNNSMPINVAAEDGTVAFRVRYVSFDPFRGLDASLTDKTTGDVAHFSGPARTMRTSFLMALTEGDKAKEAKFLRLGCVWTNDPKLFKTL